MECRTSCCQLDFEQTGALVREIQTSAGLPPAQSASFTHERVVTCYERDKTFPAEYFVDRLDERVSQDPIFLAAAEQCGNLDGAPGTLTAEIQILSSGQFTVSLEGNIQGTTAAGCVEDLLHERLRFRPARWQSHLAVSIELGDK